jgi:hypothetical protein
MAEGKRPSVDNPEYFLSGGSGAAQGRTVSQGEEALRPPAEIMESLERIESLGERSAAKGRRGRLSLSLKRLFGSGGRRGSSNGQSSNEYMPSPLQAEAAGSLPASPGHKAASFLHYPSLGRARKVAAAKRLSEGGAGEGCGPERAYYNITGESETNNNNPSLLSEEVGTPELPPPGPGARGRAGRGALRSRPGPAPVPGMEPPPAPLLHSACRGFLPAEAALVAVVYSQTCPSAGRWAQQLARALAGPRVAGQPVERLGELLLEDRQEAEEIIFHARVQVVVLSPALLTWLGRTGVLLGRLLRPGRTVALLQGVAAREVEEQAAASLPAFTSWPRVEVRE